MNRKKLTAIIAAAGIALTNCHALKYAEPKVIIEQTESGKREKKIWDCDGDGTPDFYLTSVYDTQGRLTEREDFDGDGKSERISSYQYHENGTITETIKTGAGILTFTRDTKGRTMRSTMDVFGDGSVEERSTYHHNADGTKELVLSYLPNEDKPYKIKINHYDEDGRLKYRSAIQDATGDGKPDYICNFEGCDNLEE